MLVNLVGPFFVNRPFGTEIAFSKGLQAIGVDVNEVDPNLHFHGQGLEVDADYTVVFKTAMSYNRYLLDMKGPVVVYQPDDLHYPHIKEMMRGMQTFAEHALVFQRSGVQECLDIGYKTAQTLMLTADPYLYRPLGLLKKDIDFCFVGSFGDPYAHSSRRKMCETLRLKGHSVVVASTNDVHQVNEIYNRSKVVLNHAADVGLPFGHGRGYQCRHFEAGFARSCLLSNKLYGIENQSISGYLEFEDERSLLDKALTLMNDGLLRYDLANILYEQVMERHHPVVRARELVAILESL